MAGSARGKAGRETRSQCLVDRGNDRVSALLCVLGLLAIVLQSPRPAEEDPAGLTASDAACVDTPKELPHRDRFDLEDRRFASKVIVVLKRQRRLMLFDAGRSLGCWPVALGFEPTGDKLREGDGRTPEGWYRTSDKPWSRFRGAIAIHYPNRDDAKRALQTGVIDIRTGAAIRRAHRRGRLPPQDTALGGQILIHGGTVAFDWTAGCIALEDADLSVLRRRLSSGMRASMLILP